MFSDWSICPKKDKRMLVLLAFGSLIILFRLCSVFFDDDLQNARWIWSEGSDQKIGLHRETLETTTGGNTTLMGYTALINYSTDLERKASPRVAFLLGLPFPINSGGIDELEMLPGIGPKLAGSIIEYRDRYGPITDRRALMKVPGIGPKMSAKLSPLLTFEEE